MLHSMNVCSLPSTYCQTTWHSGATWALNKGGPIVTALSPEVTLCGPHEMHGCGRAQHRQRPTQSALLCLITGISRGKFPALVMEFFVFFFCIVQSSGWKSPKQEQTTTGQVSQVHTCTCLWGHCEDSMSCICPTPGLQFSPYTWLLKKLSKQAEEFLQVRKFWETRELQASPGSLCPWFTTCLLHLPW